MGWEHYQKKNGWRVLHDLLLQIPALDDLIFPDWIMETQSSMIKFLFYLLYTLERMRKFLVLSHKATLVLIFIQIIQCSNWALWAWHDSHIFFKSCDIQGVIVSLGHTYIHIKKGNFKKNLQQRTVLTRWLDEDQFYLVSHDESLLGWSSVMTEVTLQSYVACFGLRKCLHLAGQFPDVTWLLRLRFTIFHTIYTTQRRR